MLVSAPLCSHGSLIPQAHSVPSWSLTSEHVCARCQRGEFMTLPHYFKTNGYITLGGGKIFQ